MILRKHSDQKLFLFKYNYVSQKRQYSGGHTSEAIIINNPKFLRVHVLTSPYSIYNYVKFRRILKGRPLGDVEFVWSDPQSCQ